MVVNHNNFTKRKYLHLTFDKKNKLNENVKSSCNTQTISTTPIEPEVNFENNVSNIPLSAKDTAKIAQGIQNGFTFYLVCEKQKYILDNIKFDDALSAKLTPFENDLWRYDSVVVVFTGKCPNLNDTCFTLRRHEIVQVDYWENNMKPGSMFVYKNNRPDQFKNDFVTQTDIDNNKQEYDNGDSMLLHNHEEIYKDKARIDFDHNSPDENRILTGLARSYPFYYVCDNEIYLMENFTFDQKSKMITAYLIPIKRNEIESGKMVVLHAYSCPDLKDGNLQTSLMDLFFVNLWVSDNVTASRFLGNKAKKDEFNSQSQETDDEGTSEIRHYAKRIFLFSLLGIAAIIASVPVVFLSAILWGVVVGVAVVFLTWAFILSIKGIKAGKKVPKEKRSGKFKGALFYCWTFFVMGILFYLLGLFGLLSSL